MNLAPLLSTLLLLSFLLLSIILAPFLSLFHSYHLLDLPLTLKLPPTLLHLRYGTVQYNIHFSPCGAEIEEFDSFYLIFR